MTSPPLPFPDGDHLDVIADEITARMQTPRVRADSLRDSFGLLSPADLAGLIGIDERTLAMWRARGCGPDYTKLGRNVFYRRHEVQEWIALNVMPTDRTA